VQLNRELDETGLTEAEKKEILRKLTEKYALLLLESAESAVQRGGNRIELEDLRKAAEIVGITCINLERIKEIRDEAAAWLINESSDGIWGWWSSLDPPDLNGPIKKIWSTAISLRSLLRAGVEAETSHILNGIMWLLDNRIPGLDPCWARLPNIYRDKSYGDCLLPNAYETSCVLLALIEAMNVSCCDKQVIQAGVENLLRHQHEGYWSIFLTPQSPNYGRPDLGATSLALTTIARAKTNGFETSGIEGAISDAANWLTKQQRDRETCGAWGEPEDRLGSTAKTSDAIRALIESGVPQAKRAIDAGVSWLLRNQGVFEDGRGWGWRRQQDGQLIASDVANTAFAVAALLRAGKQTNCASIQTAFRWLINHRRGNNWGADTPRVILAFSEYVNSIDRSIIPNVGNELPDRNAAPHF
jgi:hypothetical protein